MASAKSVAAEPFQVRGYVIRHPPVPPQIGSYFRQPCRHEHATDWTHKTPWCHSRQQPLPRQACFYSSSVLQLPTMVLRHIRHLLTVDVTAALCRCLKLSRLDYCNSLLYQLSSASFQKLKRIQHKAARLVIGGDVEPTNAMTSLHWLPVPEIIKFKVTLLAHKALTTGMPSYIASTLSPNSHVRSLRSESSNFLNIPIPRNRFEAKSLKFSPPPRTWNGLPLQLRASDSYSIFKANLKIHLFFSGEGRSAYDAYAYGAL